MAVFEVIYVVAATLWIIVVTATLFIGGRYLLKLRARRRRLNRLIDGARLPFLLGRAAVSTLFGPDLRVALPWASRRR